MKKSSDLRYDMTAIYIILVFLAIFILLNVLEYGSVD